MSKLIKVSFAVLFVVALSSIAFAQPGNPGDPVPIDGGISLLIAAGAALGGKIIYDKNKKKA